MKHEKKLHLQDYPQNLKIIRFKKLLWGLFNDAMTPLGAAVAQSI
jgi:hypothetical protein